MHRTSTNLHNDYDSCIFDEENYFRLLYYRFRVQIQTADSSPRTTSNVPSPPPFLVERQNERVNRAFIINTVFQRRSTWKRTVSYARILIAIRETKYIGKMRNVISPDRERLFFRYIYIYIGLRQYIIFHESVKRSGKNCSMIYTKVS